MDDGTRDVRPPAHESPGGPRRRTLLAARPFRRLIAATFASTLGDWIGFLAIIALTARILGPTRAAAFAVSGVMVARILPSILLGPVAGVFVDRWDRKRVLIATDIGRGVVMALIPFTQEILALVLATLLIEVLSALFAPAKDAVLPTLVTRDQLVVANQLNLVVTYGSLPVAGVVYATLVATAGRFAPPDSLLAARPMALAIWFNAGSFLVSALLLAAIPMGRSHVRSTLEPAVPGVWVEFREGLRFIAGQRVIRSFILGVMVAAAAAGVVISVGEFFADLMNAGPSGYGLLVAMVGAGLVVGLLLAAPLVRRTGPERLFPPAIGVAGGALVITAAAPDLLLASLPATLMGVGTGVAFVVGYTVIQQRSDDRIRGRTFAAFSSGVRVAIFGSTIVVPAAIGILGREQRELVVQPDGTAALLYPYAFGGIRLTLAMTGTLTVVGALATWRALVRGLAAEDASRGAADIPRRGAFIVFEGGDGSGKSTQIERLRLALEASGRPVVVTREPGGTAIGEQVRAVLLDRGSDGLSARSEALLYAAARAQHVDEVIAPALDAGATVLCDRFIDSSIVYQGVGRGLGEGPVGAINRWATTGIAPDLTVLLDVDADEGLRRAAAQGDHDRLEAAGPDFHRAVAHAYRRRAAEDPGRWLVLDASLPVDVLHERVRGAVDAVIDAPSGMARWPGAEDAGDGPEGSLTPVLP
jgi:dTMP kinase